MGKGFDQIREREKEKGNYNADVKAVVFKNYR